MTKSVPTFEKRSDNRGVGSGALKRSAAKSSWIFYFTLLLNQICMTNLPFMVTTEVADMAVELRLVTLHFTTALCQFIRGRGSVADVEPLPETVISLPLGEMMFNCSGDVFVPRRDSHFTVALSLSLKIAGLGVIWRSIAKTNMSIKQTCVNSCRLVQRFVHSTFK